MYLNFLIKLKDAKNVTFNGELRACASNIHPVTGEYLQQIKVYRTVGGRYVLHQFCKNISDTVDTFDYIDALQAHLGYSDLAKQIYDQFNLNYTILFD